MPPACPARSTAPSHMAASCVASLPSTLADNSSASAHHLSAAAAAAAAAQFSPLVLFECTLSNASLLVESMPDRDLLHALRIVAALHSRVVDVMDPRYDRLVRLGDAATAAATAATAAAAAAAAASTATSASASNSATVTNEGRICADAGTLDSSLVDQHKRDDRRLHWKRRRRHSRQCRASAVSSKIIASDNGISGIGNYSSNNNNISNTDENDNSDAPSSIDVRESDDEEATRRVVQAKSQATVPENLRTVAESDDVKPDVGSLMADRRSDAPSGASSDLLFGKERLKHQHHWRSTAASGSAISSGVNCSSPAYPLECKTIFRRAYKILKGGGPHLFDFSKPFVSPFNQKVANQVLKKAQEMAVGKDWPTDVWKKIPNQYKINAMFFDFRCKIKRKNQLSKLSRRQKGLELLSDRVPPEVVNRFQSILTRDYMSSDEECVVGGGSGSESSQIRVRRLAWESEELRNLKRQLDSEYYSTQQQCLSAATSSNIGGVKRLAEVAMATEDASSVSQRLPPVDAPRWAVK